MYHSEYVTFTEEALKPRSVINVFISSLCCRSHMRLGENEYENEPHNASEWLLRVAMGTYSIDGRQKRPGKIKPTANVSAIYKSTPEDQQDMVFLYPQWHEITPQGHYEGKACYSTTLIPSYRCWNDYLHFNNHACMCLCVILPCKRQSKSSDFATWQQILSAVRCQFFIQMFNCGTIQCSLGLWVEIVCALSTNIDFNLIHETMRWIR